MKRTAFAVLVALSFCACEVKKPGYDIRIHVSEGALPSDTLYLEFCRQGVFTPLQSKTGELPTHFKDTLSLEEGVYRISTNTTPLFQFIISKNEPQRFSVTFDPENILWSLTFEGSPENTDYVRYLKKTELWNREYNDLFAAYDFVKDIPDSVRTIHRKADSIDRIVSDYTLLTASRHKRRLSSKIIRAQVPVPIPERVEDKETFVKTHFWDHVDLSDKRMTNTPVLPRHLIRFVEALNGEPVRERVSLLRGLLEKARECPSIYNYLLDNLYLIYGSDESLLRDDEVIIMLAEEHLLKQDSTRLPLEKRIAVEELLQESKKNRIGEISADLILEDISDRPIRLHDIEAKYLLLYFFDTECGVCRETTENLKLLSERYGNQGLKVVSIYTEYEYDKWRRYVSEKLPSDWINLHDPRRTEQARERYALFGLPAIYLLDEEKRIVLKNIPPPDVVLSVYGAIRR